MKKEQLAKIANIFKHCNKRCPDNDKIIKLSSYDRPGYIEGPALHMDYLIIGNALFIISAEERKLMEEFLHE